MVREALMEALAHRSRLPPRSPYLTGDVEAPIRWGLGTRRAESLSGPLAEAKEFLKQWGAGRQSKRNGFVHLLPKPAGTIPQPSTRESRDLRSALACVLDFLVHVGRDGGPHKSAVLTESCLEL